jgi:hypothetical protein
VNWLSLWLDILESVGFCAVAQCELLGSSGRNSICLWLCVCAMQSLRLLYTGHNFSKSIFVFSLASILMLDIELTLSLSLLMCAKQLGHLHSWVGRLQLSLPINSVVSFGDDVRVSLYFTCRRLVTQQQNSPTLLVYIQYRQLKCIYYYYKKRKRNRYWYMPAAECNPIYPFPHWPSSSSSDGI